MTDALKQLQELEREWREGPITEEDCRHCCADQLSALFPTLAEEQQAMVAAAYLNAAQQAKAYDPRDVHVCNLIANRIRALASSDPLAALQQLEMAAEKEGWKKGVAAGFLSAAVIVRDGKIDEQESYPPEADKVVAALDKLLREAREKLRGVLDSAKCLALEIEEYCPCGARPESPGTHPHVSTCPVDKLVRLLWAAAAQGENDEK